MPIDKNASRLALDNDEHAEERGEEHSVYLQHGRTLAVATEGMTDIIEIRASSGQVELRIQMTEDGPVLRMDAVKLAVNAAESIQMQCKTFSVQAAEAVEIASKGNVAVKAEGDVDVESPKDVRVRGDKIFLN